MSQRVAFAVLLAFFCSCCCVESIAGEQQQINVEIYYESLCPDSIYFVTKELAPVYEDFHRYLNLTFVPFGKASWIKEEDQTHFSCQHGPAECEGNRAQACAIHIIQHNLTEVERQRTIVQVVDCVMSRHGSASAVAPCAESKGLNKQLVNNIKSCARTDLGNQLLIDQGLKTQAVESRLSFVPTIVINNVKTQSAFRNFSATICNLITGNEKPTICSHVRIE